MLKLRKTISIFIVCGLLISYFSYSAIHSAHATDGGGAWAQFGQYNLKEFVLDTAARVVARLQLTSGLNSLARQVVQSGRTGRSPAFIQNWRNFITDAEYRGEDVFRSILANTQSCPHLKNDLLSMFGVKSASPLTQNIRTGNLDPYTVRGKCTLPTGWSIQNYNNDFTGNGGWDALTRLAQPQNNFYGSTIMAMNELNAQRNLDRTADRGEGSANGFTGVRRSSRTGNSCDTPPAGQCTTLDGSIGSGISCTSDSACLSKGWAKCTGGGPSQARCTFLGNITTPSKILGEGASTFIDKNLSWLTTTDELSEVLGSFLGAMLNKLVDYTADSIAGGTTTPNPTRENVLKDQVQACVRACNNNSTGSQVLTCIDNCYRTSGADLPNNYDSSNFTGSTGPTPVPTVAPPTLPPASLAVTLCDDGTTSPDTTKTCLTGQWVRQGDSLNIDPTGLCDSSHCVVLNYSIVIPPTAGSITQNTRPVSTLTGASDWPQGTRVDTSMGTGDTPYTLDIGNGATRFTITVPIPSGGGGGGGGTPSTGGEECSDGVDNDGDFQIDYPADPDCTSLTDTNEAF